MSYINITRNKYSMKTTAIALWLATLCTALPYGVQPAQAKLLGITEQEEIEAGKEVAAQAEKEFGGVLPTNHAMSRRVRALGEKFAAMSTRKNIPYSYKVLNNDEVLNAFAAPGGPVYVTKKLVETTANDAELAYVLGHETAHIDRSHIANQVKKQQKVGIIAGILGAVLGKGKSGDFVGLATSLGVAALQSGYSRADENDSDAVGVRWMSKLGYDPRAAVSMLGKLGDGAGGIAKYLASHPDPKDRQARVQKLIDSDKLLDVAKKNGGPKLGANTGYTNTSYDGPDGQYDAPVYYPPTSNTPSSSGQNQEFDFGAPLVVVRNNNLQVVMAPVSGLVRWAGASVQANGNDYTVRRGTNILEMRRYENAATLNGRAIVLPAAPEVYNGLLYAPLGNLAQGVGATASLDSNTRTVQMTLNGVSSGFVRVP